MDADIEHTWHRPGIAALLRKSRSDAGSATRRDRLLAAVPISATLLEQYVLRGDTGHLAARGALGPGAVAHILEQRRRRRGHRPPVRMILSDCAAARHLDVSPHALETYDALSRADSSDPDE